MYRQKRHTDTQTYKRYSNVINFFVSAVGSPFSAADSPFSASTPAPAVSRLETETETETESEARAGDDEPLALRPPCWV